MGVEEHAVNKNETRMVVGGDRRGGPETSQGVQGIFLKRPVIRNHVIYNTHFLSFSG